MGKNVAIKCTYNNGGEDPLVGFSGTCTEDIIKWNIESGRRWCGNDVCECKKYYRRGFKGSPPVDPCMESTLFREWKYGGGQYHKGERAGKPIHIREVAPGKIAILTTRFPGDGESDRRIVGFFKIARVTNNPGEETWMYADEQHHLRLPLEEAKDLYFWDYRSTSGGAKWGTLLHRYLDDSQVVSILTDLKETLRDENAKHMVNELLNEDLAGIPPWQGRGSRGSTCGERARRVHMSRKYGPGGEGPDHKRLKEWIANHPEEIGLTNVIRMEMEYHFLCGDAVDILFELPGGRYTVVEIETIDPFPGCHQALKYKVLKCAELGEDINSPDVLPVLVAWTILGETREFCERYGIRPVEKRV